MKRMLMMATAVLLTGVGGVPAGAQDREAPRVIAGYYRQYLGREASAPEIAGWVQHWQQYGQAAVQSGFLASDEYYGRHGSSPQGLVAGLYTDVLGRPGSPQEIQGWVNTFNQSGDRLQLTSQFVASAQQELAQRQRPPRQDHYREWDRERGRDRHPPWSPFAPHHDHR